MSEEKRAVKNIEDFLEKHGDEGFLKLFFKEYLYNLIEHEIASKGDNISNDFGILQYRDDKIRDRSELNKYSKEIKKECEKKATEIVNDLKQDQNVQKFLSGDFENLDDDFFDNYMKEKFHEIFKKWEGKNERGK